MAERKSTPQVTALRKCVEDKFGRSLMTHKDFEDLSIEICQVLQDEEINISESTLERVWGYSTRTSSAISYKTLDSLSRFIGKKNWNDFKAGVGDFFETESNVLTGNIIDSDTLGIGTRLRLTWMPDRECICKYLGGHRFIVEEVKNAHLSNGDTFSCIQFQPGRELFLDKYISVTNVEGRYFIGRENGLTSVEIVS